MTKEPDNPFEDFQKQMRSMFKSQEMRPFFGDEEASEASDDNEPEAVVEEDEGLARVHSFSHKPREISDYLDRFVIRQNDAKKVLSVAICDHYNHAWRAHELGHARPPNPDGAKGETGDGGTFDPTSSVETCVACHGENATAPVGSVKDPFDAHFIDEDIEYGVVP